MGVDTNRIEFLNTYIDNLTALEAKKAVDRLIQTDGYHYVVTPNSDIVVKMQDDAELKKICDKADLILTDGQIVVKLSRYLGNPIKERVCMTDCLGCFRFGNRKKIQSVFVRGQRRCFD